MKKLVKNLDEPKEEPKKTEEKAKPKEETKVEKVPSDKTTVAGFTRPLVDTEAVEGQIRAELAAQLDEQSRDGLMRAKWSVEQF